MPSRLFLALCLSTVLLAASAAAFAGPKGNGQGHGHGQGPNPAPRGQDQGPRRNDNGLSDSVRRIERSTRGQVLSAEQVPFDGRNINRIKVVDDRGRVRVYMDDPQPQKKNPEPTPPTRGDDD